MVVVPNRYNYTGRIVCLDCETESLPEERPDTRTIFTKVFLFSFAFCILFSSFFFVYWKSSSNPNHGSSSSVQCHVYHHVGGRRHTPVVCNESREPHTIHYSSGPVTKNSQKTTHTNHYPSRLVEFFLKLQGYGCFKIITSCM